MGDPSAMDTVKRSLGLKAEQMAEIERRRAQRAHDVRNSPGSYSNQHGGHRSSGNGASGSGGLANRRSHLKNRNLTIVTPSYGSTANSIKSAPIANSHSHQHSHLQTVHPPHQAPATSSSLNPSINASNPPPVLGHVSIARSSAAGHAGPPHSASAGSIVPPAPHTRATDGALSQQHRLQAGGPAGPPRLPQQPRTANPAGVGFNNQSLPSPILASPPPATHPHRHHHSSSQHSAHFLQPTMGSNTSRQSFLGLFETFYDTLTDSRVLHANLADQMRRSAALLGTLQQTATLSETRFDKRLGDMCTSLTRDLQLLEARLDRLEKAWENGDSGSKLPPIEKQREQQRQGQGRASDMAEAEANRLRDAMGSMRARLENLEKSVQTTSPSPSPPPAGLSHQKTTRRPHTSITPPTPPHPSLPPLTGLPSAERPASTISVRNE
jgi:hypothetical protein